MNSKTVITYDNGKNTIVFSISSPFWVTNITGASSNDIKLSESQGTGQTGSYITAQSIQAKDITINGVILGDIESNRKKLLACILPGAIARLIVKQDGQSLYIEGAPKKTPEIQNGEGSQAFQFVFHCPFPYWKTSEESNTVIAGIQPMFMLPFSTAGTWYLSQYSRSLFANVMNSGDSPIEFEATFAASSEVHNPQLVHVKKQASIKINLILTSGESFTVSTIYGKKSALYIHADGTTENGFRYLSVTSDLNLSLDPGDNIFRYDADQNREGLQVSIRAPKGVLSGV